MNKEIILKKLDKINLDINRIMVISGAALVLHGIIEETNDIDVACDKEYYDSLKWKTKIGAYGIEIKYNDVFEIGHNLYFPQNIIYINNYKVMDVHKCFEIKKELNRTKDKKTISLIERWLKGSDNNGK